MNLIRFLVLFLESYITGIISIMVYEDGMHQVQCILANRNSLSLSEILESGKLNLM